MGYVFGFLPIYTLQIKTSFTSTGSTLLAGHTGSKSFEKTPFTANEMCTTIFKEMNFCWLKIEAQAWSDDRTLGIFNVVAMWGGGGGGGGGGKYFQI